MHLFHGYHDIYLSKLDNLMSHLAYEDHIIGIRAEDDVYLNIFALGMAFLLSFYLNWGVEDIHTVTDLLW